MIQATDFVCPTCKAQVGKACTNRELIYSYGRSEFKVAPRFGKPHSERRSLAKSKRKAEVNGNQSSDGAIGEKGAEA